MAHPSIRGRGWLTLARAAILLNAAITVPLAAILNLWQDEAYTLHTTGGTIGYAFTEALAFEQNAPLYFVIINLWRHLDGTLFFARLFSVFCIAATLALVPGLVKRYLPAINPGVVTLVAALNPISIWAALDLRVYAMIVLLSALALATFYDAFVDDAKEHRVRRAAVYALVVAVCLYTQYFLAFLVAGEGLVLLFYRPRRFPLYFAAGLAALVSFVPVALRIPGQIGNFQQGFVAPDSPLQAANVVIDIVAHYLVPLHLNGNAAAGLAIGAALFAAAVLLLRRYETRDGQGLVIAITAAGVVLLSIGLYVAQVHILNRHLSAEFLPVLLSTFALATYLREPARSRAVATWAAISICTYAFALVATYHALAKPGDWIRVSAYIQSHERAGEPIAVFEAENALPLAYYYRGPNRIVPIPQGVNFSKYVVTNFVVRNQAQIERAFPKAKRLWLVTAGACRSLNVHFGCDAVASYVARRYRILSNAAFYRSNVALLERR